MPGTVTVLLFTLVSTRNDFFLPFIMLNNPKWYPVTVGLAQWQSQASGGSGAQALFSLVITGSPVSIIPLIAAFLLAWQGLQIPFIPIPGFIVIGSPYMSLIITVFAIVLVAAARQARKLEINYGTD